MQPSNSSSLQAGICLAVHFCNCCFGALFASLGCRGRCFVFSCFGFFGCGCRCRCFLAGCCVGGVASCFGLCGKRVARWACARFHVFCLVGRLRLLDRGRGARRRVAFSGECCSWQHHGAHCNAHQDRDDFVCIACLHVLCIFPSVSRVSNNCSVCPFPSLRL